VPVLIPESPFLHGLWPLGLDHIVEDDHADTDTERDRHNHLGNDIDDDFERFIVRAGDGECDSAVQELDAGSKEHGPDRSQQFSLPEMVHKAGEEPGHDR